MTDGFDGDLSVGRYPTIPAALDCLEPAEPSEYRLSGTGELVVDPDYTASFTITPPQKH